MTHVEVCGTRALLLLALKPAGFNARLGSSFRTDRESFAACYAICKDSTYALWDKHPMSPGAILLISTLLCVWGRCQRSKEICSKFLQGIFALGSSPACCSPGACLHALYCTPAGLPAVAVLSTQTDVTRGQGTCGGQGALERVLKLSTWAAAVFYQSAWQGAPPFLFI